MEQEIWKDIPGYEGLYQASSFGNIKSLGKKEYIGSQGRKFGYSDKILNKNINKIGGYNMVALYLGKRRTIKVSRLIASAFLGLDINNTKILVCHKDDITINDYVDNLFLGTHKDNMQDMIKKGRHGTRYGEDINTSTLSNKDVIFIKYNHTRNKGENRKYADMFGVKIDTIRNIINGKTWKNIL